MTRRRPRPWVGDQVHDPGTGREAIITDVRGGSFILRPVYGGGAPWTADDPARLTVTVSSEQRRLEGHI